MVIALYPAPTQSQKSFYGKAYVEVSNSNIARLWSYTSCVAEFDIEKRLLTFKSGKDFNSRTTNRHKVAFRYFLKLHYNYEA